MIIQQIDALTVHSVIQRLTTSKSTLLIHTIPDKEWHLSCYRHKSLLVDVYTLTGTIAGTKRAQSWQCGRLCELLIKLLRYGRKVQYISHIPSENNVSSINHRSSGDTLEEDALKRLKSGDMVFYATGEAWRLTGTWFGTGVSQHSLMYHIAKESMLGTPETQQHMFKSTKMEYVLLGLLAKEAEFVETPEAKVLTFKGAHS